jgi:hypothetical protein
MAKITPTPYVLNDDNDPLSSHAAVPTAKNETMAMVKDNPMDASGHGSRRSHIHNCSSFSGSPTRYKQPLQIPPPNRAVARVL